MVWPLVDTTRGQRAWSLDLCPFPGHLGRPSLCHCQWCGRQALIQTLQLIFYKIATAVLEEKKSLLSLEKAKASSHCLLSLLTGLMLRELVHLVQSCQNREREGQQINVREAAKLHKSLTPSRETPSWPAGTPNLVAWANRHQNDMEIKRLILPQSKPLKAVSLTSVFH